MFARVTRSTPTGASATVTLIHQAGAVSVMDGAGYYNEHSAQQLEAATAGVELLRRAAASVPIPDRGPLVIADLGSSEGRNSLEPLSAAVDTIRKRPGGDVPIAVVHTDLPQNDFSSLFDVVA